MWGRGREELTALGIHPRDWVAGWMERIARGDATAFGSHAILGCDRESEGICSTAFQASQSFEGPVGLSITKEMRRAIPALMRDRGIHTACVYSLCVDPGAPKWFRLLGFEEDTEYKGAQRGAYVSRRFIRRV